MPRTKTPGRNPAPKAAATLLKPILCAALAIAAIAAIVWLAGASATSATMDFPAGSLVEFMAPPAPAAWTEQPFQSAGARPTFPAEADAPEYAQAHAAAWGNGNAGRVDLSQPQAMQARRVFLTRRSGGASAKRNGEFDNRTGSAQSDAFAQWPAQAATEQYVPAANAQSRAITESQFSAAPSPAVTLALARRMLDGPTAIPLRREPVGGAVSEVAGAVANGSGAMARLFARGARAGKGAGIASAGALANVSADYPPLSVDDLFSLKLRGEYGTSEGNLKDGGIFEDRFLVLGGDKKIEFAGADQMKLKMDGVITTGGRWDYPSMEQDLSGIALNAGPEIKFPELPIKLNLNLGAGWLKRKATLADSNGVFADTNPKADIDSFVYGGGAALHSDWQWRMFKITGLAGVQYATSTDKAHDFTFTDQNGDKQPHSREEKLTSSAWDLPAQLRIGGEYKLLNALSVLPSLWGGYTYNLSGKNGAFRNGHIAGAESTWRRHGMTWNRNSYHIGGELRIRAVDRFDLWFAYQKEWAGDESGKYMGGGLQIAF